MTGCGLSEPQRSFWQYSPQRGVNLIFICPVIIVYTSQLQTEEHKYGQAYCFFCSSCLSSTKVSTNVWKQLQMHLQEMHPTYRAHRVDSSWWPRWHFHKLQGCSHQTCSLSPPCKSLHEWKASLVSCGDPEYLEGTHTMVQCLRSQWKAVKVPITQTVFKWKSCREMVSF